MPVNIDTRYGYPNPMVPQTQNNYYGCQYGQDCSIGEALSGGGGAVNQDYAPPRKMTRKEARAWRKQYRKATNCSRREARQAYREAFGVTSPRQEAKAWVKGFKETFNCKRKDAKKAYEQVFGHKMPKGSVGKIARGAAIFSLGFIPGVGLPLMGLVAAEAIRENIAMKNKGDAAFTPINDFIMNGRFNLHRKNNPNI